MLVALKRLWIQVTADKRRFGTLCVVSAVGLLLWARLIVIANIPRHAVADPSQEQPVDVAESAHGKQRDPVVVELEETPQRDPFLISLAHFPKPTPVPNLVPDAGKSQPQLVETGDQAHARKHAQLRKLVERLELEAVMTGLPMAVISGTTYRPGDLIPAADGGQARFKLVEVRSRSIVLDYEDHRFELTIGPLGGE